MKGEPEMIHGKKEIGQKEYRIFPAVSEFSFLF